MTSESIPSAIGPRGFLVTPSYVRLWFAGGVGNSMRWLELLVAGIFTYDVTHSTFLVAVVTVARSLPMLFIGANRVLGSRRHPLSGPASLVRSAYTTCRWV
jgi:hypothetical protein